MPRYEYRTLRPLLFAESQFLSWIDDLDRRFAVSPLDDRNIIVRNTLHEIYLGRPYAEPGETASLAERSLIYSFDPRNVTLEPEYYGDIDAAKYAERKPPIWLWMMFDRSPLGLNHWLGFRLRAMLAKYVFKHIGANVKIFHGVEVSFGYNLTVEDNCVIHKYVLLDDRGEIVIHEGSSISDYANVYSHDHDLNDSMIVTKRKTEIGPRARITYHATVMNGVRVEEHALVGCAGVATKDVEPYNVVVGVPAKPVKVKSIAPSPPMMAQPQECVLTSKNGSG